MTNSDSLEFNPYVPRIDNADGSYMTGAIICPKCGARGEIWDGITMLSVTDKHIEENPIICPVCSDKAEMPITIGFAGIVKGSRQHFFDMLIQNLD